MVSTRLVFPPDLARCRCLCTGKLTTAPRQPDLIDAANGEAANGEADESAQASLIAVAMGVDPGTFGYFASGRRVEGDGAWRRNERGGRRRVEEVSREMYVCLSESWGTNCQCPVIL